MAEPRASRPHMPEYGLAPPEGGKRLLPWRWAEERLAGAHNYWLSTSRPDGRPAASAVWGVWIDGRWYFSCAPNALKARNLRARPDCVVTTERADEAVILEGTAAQLEGGDENSRVIAAYNEKYNWDMSKDERFWVVTPHTVFAFIESKDEPGNFAATATRWRFD